MALITPAAVARYPAISKSRLRARRPHTEKAKPVGISAAGRSVERACSGWPLITGLIAGSRRRMRSQRLIQDADSSVDMRPSLVSILNRVHPEHAVPTGPFDREDPGSHPAGAGACPGSSAAG